MTGKKDISNEIKLGEGRALPGGWSQYEIQYNNQRIGWLESGEPMDFIDGYSFEVIQEGDHKRLKVYKSDSGRLNQNTMETLYIEKTESGAILKINPQGSTDYVCEYKFSNRNIKELKILLIEIENYLMHCIED